MASLAPTGGYVAPQSAPKAGITRSFGVLATPFSTPSPARACHKHLLHPSRWPWLSDPLSFPRSNAFLLSESANDLDR